MKKLIPFLLIALLVSLSACADSSTVGTDLDKQYDITLSADNNQGLLVVSIPVTVEADSKSATTQDTQDTATATPDTNVELPLPIK